MTKTTNVIFCHFFRLFGHDKDHEQVREYVIDTLYDRISEHFDDCLSMDNEPSEFDFETYICFPVCGCSHMKPTVL